MVTTFDLTADVSDDRKVHITLTLPEEIPAGRVNLHITATPENGSEASTLGDLLHSEFFGMWKDRTDILDTDSFASELRHKAWTRQP